MLRRLRDRKCRSTAVVIMMLMVPVGVMAAGANAPGDDTADARANWLLRRAALQDLPLTGVVHQTDAVGGSAGELAVPDAIAGDEGGGGALPVLASLVLPGAGEAMLGHKRGYLMMALDIFAWTQVAKKHGDGNDLRDEYYAFADAHYRDGLLAEAYKASSADIERDGMGELYFPAFGTVTDSTQLGNLPLYVTKEEDRREYYENLGKWDQFVFGWDDFLSPQSYAQLPGNEDYTPTGDPKIDLGNPWISQNRETYRLMRDASNDAFKSRDRWLYLNLGLRIFSVVQTAWLNGLLGGGDDGDGPAYEGDNRLSVGGHEVRFIAQPTGLRRATVAAAVSF